MSLDYSEIMNTMMMGQVFPASSNKSLRNSRKQYSKRNLLRAITAATRGVESMKSPIDFRDPSITRMLRMYAQGDRRHQHEIGNYFINAIREKVAGRLRKQYPSFLDLDEGMIAALKSILSDIEHNRIQVDHRAGIQKLLVDKLYDKITDAYRKETAAKRTRQRELPLLEDRRLCDARVDEPFEGESLDDLSQIIVDFISEPKDFIVRLICQWWLLYDMQPSEIHKRLQSQFPPHYHRSLRTIQIRLKELKLQLKKRLQDD
jgi:hypothetical protein